MKVLAFGIVKEIFSNSVVDVDLADHVTINQLKTLLEENIHGLIYWDRI